METKVAGIKYFTSESGDGNMSLRWDINDTAKKNRENFFSKIKILPDSVVWCGLVHGSDIHHAQKRDHGKEFVCDSLITTCRDLALAIMTADCFPLVMYEPGKKILALTHLGHRGVSAYLAQKVAKRISELGGDTNKILAFLGPGIRKESYQFETVTQVNDPEWQPYLAKSAGGLTSIDLPGFIKQQLIDSGVNKKNIFDCGINTAISENFFSHYQSANNSTNEARFLTVVKLN